MKNHKNDVEHEKIKCKKLKYCLEKKISKLSKNFQQQIFREFKYVFE